VLLAGVDLDRIVDGLSGGERRRCSLAALLLGEHDLMVLDEPTNHLDVEAVAWLARHLAALVGAGRGHPRPVVPRRGLRDDVGGPRRRGRRLRGRLRGVRARQGRAQRQAAATETRRQNLVRKELAWLRRGAPARTSKPKFRIDAANALIEDVPPPRDRLELQKFATQRLGKDVVDVEDVDLVRGDRVLLEHATWRLGPGDRVGIVGVNGAGKTSVLKLLSGSCRPQRAGSSTGRTVALQHLTQHARRPRPRGAGAGTVERSAG
jgi:ATP-binding cassette subfamily F protein uup